jgi:hypothetical protein
MRLFQKRWIPIKTRAILSHIIAAIKKALRTGRRAFAWFGLLEHYFFAGAAGTAGAVVVAVDVTVDVTADFVAGAGVCC